MSYLRMVPLVAVVLAVSTVAFADPDREDELAVLNARIAQSPANVDLLLQRAELRLLEVELDEAAADLRLVEALAPSEPRILLLRAEIDFQRGALAEAEVSLEAYVGRTGGSYRAWFLLGAVHERRDRLDAALHSYDQALAFGDDVDLYLARGRVLEATGRLDDAGRNYETGIQATGGAVVLRMELADVARRRGDVDEALAQLDPILRRARVRTRWLLLRAEILEEAGRTAEARRAREEALSDAERLLARRHSPAALAARGQALLALGRATEAERDLTQALRRAPRMTDARTALAEARRLAGGAR